jgi:hypothetical protein
VNEIVRLDCTELRLSRVLTIIQYERGPPANATNKLFVVTQCVRVIIIPFPVSRAGLGPRERFREPESDGREGESGRKGERRQRGYFTLGFVRPTPGLIERTCLFCVARLSSAAV